MKLPVKLTHDPYEARMTSSVSKPTRRKELLFVILLLILVSIFYQCYANMSFWDVDSKLLANLRSSGCPVPSRIEPVRDILIFPALRNFRVKENVSPDFGRFPLEAKDLVKIHNFTDRLLFPFMPSMTRQEKLVSLFVFQKFINICSHYNITFFIQGGSLLGSYRHHGFVPWDDDIDVYVDVKDKAKLFCSLKMATPTFDVIKYPRFQWKFYYTNTPTLRAYKYRWPFVDIFFYAVNGDDIYDVTRGGKTRAFKSHNVFPLGTSMFEGAALPAPCNVKMSLNAALYKSEKMCHTGSYNHKQERIKNNMIVRRLPCEKLYAIYPFVFRRKMNVSEDKVEEVLKIGHKVLNTVIVTNNCAATNKIS